MLDKSIQYKNIIMRADDLVAGTAYALPTGFHFKLFEEGDEYSWADIETSVGEFESTDKACKYFVDNYFTCITELKKRCLFVLDEQGHSVGTCTAWFDK